MSVTSTWIPGQGASGVHVGTAAMQTGYALATSVVTDVLAVHAPGYQAALQAMSASQQPRILVIDGDHDQMHHILEAGSLPYARASGGHLFARAIAEIPGIQAVLINCGNAFPEEQARHVAEFVHRGGMLLTTDWALKTVLQVGFPGTVSHAEGRQTGHEFVDVEIWDKSKLPAPSKGVLAKIYDAEGGKPRWWLETQSYPITRLSEGIEILLYSRQLKAAYGRGAVMVRFPWGDGMVYHMISHAFLQHQAPGGFAPCGADPAKAGMTQIFTGTVGASKATQAAYAAAEAEVPDFDAASAKNTAFSTASVIIPLIQHVGRPIETQVGPGDLHGDGEGGKG